MSKQCKGQILDQKKSRWENVYRRCKVMISDDAGDFCHNHDPERIENSIASGEKYRIVSETVDKIREIKGKEESAVGAFMRLKRPEDFEDILKEMQDAEKLADLLGGYR